MLRSEGGRLVRVVVSTPANAYFDVADLAANNMNEEADRARTLDEMASLVSVMRDFGADVIDVPELAGHPNSVFPRDVVLGTPRGYITLRMGLETRRGEEQWMARALDDFGEPCAGTITAPGTVEGGDVILAGSVAFVGLSHRTNEEGVRQLTTLLTPMGYEVRTARVPEQYLHIGGLMSAIGPTHLIASRGTVPRELFDGFEVIWVDPEGPSSGNVICLRDHEVIANAAENQHAIDTLEEHGVRVHRIELGEFRKGAGGPTCLILPVERSEG